MLRAFVALAFVAPTLASAALTVGCEASIPEQRFECDVDADCPPGQVCDMTRDRCHFPDGG